MKTKLIFLFILLISFSFSQENIKLVDSRDIIVEGYEYFSNEDYDKAIKKFSAVERNDTNYLLAQYELAYTYNQNEEYEECVEVCENYLARAKHGDKNEHSVYNMMGLALDNMDKSVESIKVYNEALKKYPKYPLYTLNKAVSYNNMDKRDKGLLEYKKLLNEHASYALGHIHIGYVAANENKHTQAILSYALGTILSGKIEHLSILNDFAEGNFEPKEYGLKLNENDNYDDFEELDLIIKNKIALDKSYKIPLKFSYPFVKQLYVTIEKLEYNSKDKGFWMQYYVPYFIAMKDEGQFENFVYYLLGVSTNEDIKKKVKNKLPEMQEFYNWHETKWAELHDKVEMEINGVKGTYRKIYDKGLPYGTGTLKNDKLEGQWEFYHKNGKISGTGEFVNSNKTGKWTYYNSNGTLSYIANYKNNIKVGKYTDYDNDGFKTEEGSFKNEKLDGIVKTFYKDGTVKGLYVFKEGKKIEPIKEYYPGGELEYVIPYNEDNEIDGEVVSYFPNKNIKSKALWKDGKRHGKYISYFINGNTYQVYNYDEGKYDGKYEEYYINGQLYEVGEYKKDKSIGENIYYYRDGKVKMKINLDENGKRNGTLENYSKDGYIIYEATYTKGELISYKFFDKDGKVTKEVARKRNKIEVEYLYEIDKPKYKGLLENNKREGEWNFYRMNGSIEATANYKDGNYDGKYTKYYRSGNVSEEYEYKEGVLTGYYISYFRNGNISKEGNYLDGNKEGKWINYYLNGDVYSTNNYLFGELNGLFDDYNVDGIINTTYNYEKGTIIESYTYDMEGNPIDTVPFNYGSAEIKYKTVTGDKSRIGTYKNGQAYGTHYFYEGKDVKSAEGSYINDEKHGNWKWYSLGNLSTEKTYDYGYLNGEFKEYYIDGSLAREGKYEYDVDVDTWKYYHYNGKLSRDMPYNKQGERHGISHYYSSEGDLQYVKYHHNGYFIGYSYNGEDGKLVKMIPIKNETAMIKTYFSNGKISCEVDLKNGEYVGVSKRYYKNGQVEYDIPNKLGDNFGDFKFYYADGTIQQEGNYYYDSFNGKRTLYYKNGKKKMELNYILGTLFGKVTLYDENGNKTKETEYYNDDIIEQKTF